MGMDTAARNNANQRAIARWAALRLLGRQFDTWLRFGGGDGSQLPGVIVSDARQWCEERGVILDWHKPWTGSLFQDGWFEWTGSWRPAYHDGSHARPVKEWRLSPAGHAVLREIREATR